MTRSRSPPIVLNVTSCITNNDLSANHFVVPSQPSSLLPAPSVGPPSYRPSQQYPRQLRFPHPYLKIKPFSLLPKVIHYV